LVQGLLILNILILAWQLPSGWPVLFSLIPYFLLLPKILKILITGLNDPNQLKRAAGLNVQLHLAFSGLFSLSLLWRLLVM